MAIWHIYYTIRKLFLSKSVRLYGSPNFGVGLGAIKTWVYFRFYFKCILDANSYISVSALSILGHVFFRCLNLLLHGAQENLKPTFISFSMFVHSLLWQEANKNQRFVFIAACNSATAIFSHRISIGEYSFWNPKRWYGAIEFVWKETFVIVSAKWQAVDEGQVTCPLLWRL